MSSVRDAGVHHHEAEEAPGLWASFGSALRLIVGWFSVAIGVVNLLVEIDRVSGEPDLGYFLFHAMLFVGGLVLLGVTWLGRGPGTLAWVAGGLVAAVGTVLSTILVTSSACCLRAYEIRHGWPFALAARDGAPGGAGRWHIDSQHLLADVLFWSYAGLLVLVVIGMARRAGDHTPPPGPAPATHAERRAYIEHPPGETPTSLRPAAPPETFADKRADGP